MPNNNFLGDKQSWTTQRTTLAGIGLLSCLACGAPEPDNESARFDIAESETALIGGRPTPEHWWDAVGAIYSPDFVEAGLCTGSLISPTLVLTAKHCAMNAAAYPELRVVFALGPDAYAPDHTVVVQSWSWEETVEPDPDSLVARFGSDVGLAHLAEPVPNVRPLTVARLRAADRHRNALVVGYGIRNDEGELGIRQKGFMTYRGNEGNYADYVFGGLQQFFRHAGLIPVFADLSRAELLDVYADLEFIPGYQGYFDNAGPAAQTCAGDSGAPFLMNKRGSLVIVALAGAGDFPSAEHLCDFGSVAATFGPKTLKFLNEAL